MSENAGNTTNTLVIVLIVVVVALAAVLGYSFWKNSNAVPSVGDLPASSATGTGNTAAGTGTGSTGAGTGAPATGAASGAFDAKTATKVPEGTTPIDFVKLYHEDIMQGKYEEAYKMLPLDKQQSYGDAAAYADQVKAYGITSYELGTPNESGDTFSVAATQVTPQMPITYTWTLKKVSDQWYVVSRTMGGS